MRANLHLVLCCALLAACSGGGDDAPGDPQPGDDDPVYEATEIDLDLGHVSAIHSLQRAGNRALSVDVTGRWVLWDVAGHQALARGDACMGCPVLLRGDTVASGITGGIEVRAATTGAISATIATDAKRVGLSSDGAYVWAATAEHLRAWSTQGALLLDVAGDYAAARVFAAPAAVRIARGPAGATRIEAIRIADGGRSTVGFAGTFHSWFDDGERFLTAVGTAVGVHTKDGTQLALASLPTVTGLTGQGSHVWTASSGLGASLQIYAASDLTAPVYVHPLSTLSAVFPGGNQIGVYQTTGTEQILEVLTLGPTVTSSGPIPLPIGLSSFGGDPSGWLIGNGGGVVMDSAAVLGTSADRRALSLGRVWSITGAADGTAVISTASGRSVVLSLRPTETVVSHELPLAGTYVELSEDAKLLVATDNLDGSQYHEDRSLRVVKVADGAEVYTWPYRWSDPARFTDFSFARQGLVLAHLFTQSSTPWIFTTTGGAVLPSYGPGPGSGSPHRPLLSPDGTHAAFWVGSTLPGEPLDVLSASTQLYTNGALVGAVAGVPLAWVDDGHVLVATYKRGGGHQGVYAFQDQVFLYDPSGAQGVTVTLPAVGVPSSGMRQPLTPVGGSLLYSQARNAVIDYTTGATIWQGDPQVQGGVVAGDDVLFARGPRLFRAAFR